MCRDMEGGLVAVIVGNFVIVDSNIVVCGGEVGFKGMGWAIFEIISAVSSPCRSATLETVSGAFLQETCSVLWVGSSCCILGDRVGNLGVSIRNGRI